MRLLLAGDLHANLAWLDRLIDLAHDHDCDRIVQLGDFGWWPHTPWGRDFIDDADTHLRHANLTCAFIDGNHDNHPALWHTASTSLTTPEGFALVRPTLQYIPRGHSWEWDGVRFVGLGGAHSIDRDQRVEGKSWWREELIRPGDVARCFVYGFCDVLLTHDAPGRPPGLENGYKDDPISSAQQTMVREVRDHLRPRYQFHGHYHWRYSHHINETWIEGLGRDGDPASHLVIEIADRHVMPDTPMAREVRRQIGEAEDRRLFGTRNMEKLGIQGATE